jgi:lycopene cyclase domain-containing protein
MQSFTYLLINILTISLCFAFSFHHKIRFDKYFKTFLISSSIAAIPYLIWDIIFTKLGVWWFNETYTLGLSIGNLPLEEVMFFWFIPFSCTFTYYCLTKFFDFSFLKKYDKTVSLFLLLFFGLLLIFYHFKIYITIVSISCCLLIIFLAKVQSISITKLTLIYLILMLGFIPVNGVLTGYGLENPIVNYNPKDIIGIRLLTIPIEDIGFGFGLFLLNIYLFDTILKKHIN